VGKKVKNESKETKAQKNEQFGQEERFFVAWSERFSRKGFVVRLGKLLLRIVGVSLFRSCLSTGSCHLLRLAALAD
jgi:hypothetical protein